MTAAQIIVQITELTAAVNEMNQAADIYEEAVESAKSAAAELASKWEGASKDAFVAHQENAYNWYKSILSVVREMIGVIRKAIDMYDQMLAQLQKLMQGT